MDIFWQDLRFGMRQLAQNRGFSIAAILTLTLGIGATATILTVVNAVFLKGLPYHDPARLVVVQGLLKDQGDKAEAHTWAASQMDITDWRQRNTVFSDLSIWGTLSFNLEQGDQSQRLSGELVNANYFPLLGLRPALGRFFSAEEDAKPMQDYVVVLGYDFWKKTFGGDRGIVNRKIVLNGRQYQVVGVAPRGFAGLSDQAEVWIPSMIPPLRTMLTQQAVRWAWGVARLKPGVSLAQAQQQMNSVTTALSRELPQTNRGYGSLLMPIKDYWFGEMREGLLVLSIGAAILLLIACINVGSLLLTRAAAKERAWAIRVALGASRGRLVRQLLTESILLSLIGGLAGILLAQWATRVLIAVSGTQLPSFVHVTAGPGVIAAILGLSVLCGVLFGMAPIRSTYRTSLTQSLGREEKLEPPGRRPWRFQNVVVVAQVALALTLSIAAVLMTKGFLKMMHQDLGFRQDNLLTYRLDLRGGKYLNDAYAVNYLRQQYLPRLAAVPGVGQMAMSIPTIPTDPLAGGYITIEDHDSDAPDGTYTSMIHAVTPGYFEILGIPVLRGRGFNAQDTQSNVVVISKAMAEKQWPGQDPIGKRLKAGPRNKPDAPWLSVVGVVPDVRHEGLYGEKAPAPDIYMSALQFIRRPVTVNFLVRPRPGTTTAQLVPVLHKEMKAINPELPDYDFATMQERLAKQTQSARFQIIMISIFSALALVLAIIGIYGVIAYSVAQRTREIAIRMSLGADRGRILRMVVGRGAVLAGVGLVLGLVAVFFLSRLLVNLLFETSVVDPLILGGTSLGLFLVTLAANYLPARRAAVLDPMVVMRLQ
jgi:putative ABC transport system permease protein